MKRARAQSVFGPVGSDVRVTAPRVLIEAHELVATHHVGLDLASEDAYGLIWLKLPQLLVDELARVAGARIVRPRKSRIQYAVINGVPVVAWRYGKRVDSNIDQAVYGVSAARRSLFREADTEPELELELDWSHQQPGGDALSGLSDEDRAEIAAHCAAIRSMSADGHLVAVLAYASSPAGVHRVYFGYADLAENGCLHWLFREKIDAVDQVSRTRVPTPRSTTETFASGPVAAPILRPRQRPAAP